MRSNFLKMLYHYCSNVLFSTPRCHLQHVLFDFCCYNVTSTRASILYFEVFFINVSVFQSSSNHSILQTPPVDNNGQTKQIMVSQLRLCSIRIVNIRLSQWNGLAALPRFYACTSRRINKRTANLGTSQPCPKWVIT